MIIDRLNQAELIQKVLALATNVTINTPVLRKFNKEYFLVGDATDRSLFIKADKIDLGSFQNGVLDLTGFSSSFDLKSLSKASGASSDTYTEATVLSNTDPSFDSDTQTNIFNYVMFVLGINNLTLSEVELSVIGNILTIEIKKSIIYTGVLQVLF